MAHVLCFVEFGEILHAITDDPSLDTERSVARCRIELASYFAAALLMPYERFLELAQKTQYDIDRLASAFSVSFEQACQRLTALQRESARGVPVLLPACRQGRQRDEAFQRDKLQHCGARAAPARLEHTNTFRTPGVILPQFVELPDGEQFFTLSRTTERPVYSVNTRTAASPSRSACEIQHAKLVYIQLPGTAAGWFRKIGINCHLCPRLSCSQRAHDPLVVELPTIPAAAAKPAMRADGQIDPFRRATYHRELLEIAIRQGFDAVSFERVSWRRRGDSSRQGNAEGRISLFPHKPTSSSSAAAPPA